ncbi:hypothetical protein BsWGS_13554 [Bradybaena similaris]
MAANERLTDAQLVSELAKYGENISLPIKRQKRPVLIKLLNHHRVRSRSTNEKAATALPPKTNQGSSFGQWNPREETARVPPAVRPPSYNRDARTIYGSGTSRQSNVEPFVSDDSDLEQSSSFSIHHDNRSPASVYRNVDKHSADHSNIEPRGRQPRPAAATSRRGYEVVRENSTFSHDDEEEEEKPQSSARPRSLYPDLSAYKSSSSHLLQGRSDRFESSDSDIDERENKSAPYINDIKHRHIYGASPSSSKSRRHGEYVPYKARQLKSSYLTKLPRIFIIVAVLFFAVAAVSYIVMHRDYFLSWISSSGSDDVILLCSDTNTEQICYEKEVVDQALQYLRKLFESLSIKKGQVLCGEARPGKAGITVTDLQSQIYNNFSDNTNVELLLECCLQHIIVNPHWKIKALQENGLEATNKDEVATLESDAPSMSLSCRLRRSCYAVLFELCLTAAVIAVFVLLYMYINHRIKKKELEQREVYSMVDDIIEILQEHYERNEGKDSNEPPYLVVQHVRDHLLPPATRHKLQPVWDKAVAFIAANESRVQLKTRLIHGDEFDVWQWLQPPDNIPKQSPGLVSKYFERDSEISERPTVCLKICKMFNSNLESDDDWEQQVIDAVLEKCRGVDSIVHATIEPELAEGCVFIKCSNLEAAIEAKDQLHGWRRKGRVATVNYMKTDEYYRLFPGACFAKRPLYPSSGARM